VINLLSQRKVLIHPCNSLARFSAAIWVIFSLFLYPSHCPANVCLSYRLHFSVLLVTTLFWYFFCVIKRATTREVSIVIARHLPIFGALLQELNIAHVWYLSENLSGSLPNLIPVLWKRCWIFAINYFAMCLYSGWFFHHSDITPRSVYFS